MSDLTSVTLPILDESSCGTSASGSSFQGRLEAISRELVDLDEAAAVRNFEPGPFDRLLKSTISLCPECLQHVAALVYTHDGRVWIRKSCPTHGLSTAIMENDERFYFLCNKDRWGRRYAGDRVLEFPEYDRACCGGSSCCDTPTNESSTDFNFTDQIANKTCTVLVEITNACNLSCKVCYSDAKGDRVMSLEMFQRQIRELIEAKGWLDSVQLTGGEAVMHPQFWEIASFLHTQERVLKIYLPTNGLLFAKRETAERLVPLKDKLMVLLQFDGQSADANLNLRNANPTRVRQQVIEHLAELGIAMQLTMTLTKGVNDDEVGWVIDTAMRHHHIKIAALQPVTYSGRYDLAREPVERLTLSDVVKAVTSQANTRMRDDDFVPIPCSHPNCGWLTLFVRRFGLRLNVARHIDLARVMNQVAYKTVLSQQEIRDMVGSAQPALWSRVIGNIGRKIVRPTDMFGIAVKPFMDCFNYDQDRISNCCHHLLDTHGRPISFCEYNARLRTSDPWDTFPELSNVNR
ncbi:MAG: radical SAM protein [Planctomycetaceae bacterium]